jgi:hypothetical protein
MVSRVTAANPAASGAKTAAPRKTSASFSEALADSAEKLRSTEKTGSLDGIFSEASAKYHVPVNLLKAVAKAESGFRADAVSSCGAQGIMQLMPSTAASLGVKNSFDPEQNIMGGAKYLGELLDSFGGDPRLAVAAYNAGSGSVRKYGGVPPYAETQNYVKKVLAYAGEDISTNGWTSGAQSGSADASAASGGDSFGGVSAEAPVLTLADLPLSGDDYRLFAKMYVQKLEQDALNIAAENAAESEKHAG